MNRDALWLKLGTVLMLGLAAALALPDDVLITQGHVPAVAIFWIRILTVGLGFGGAKLQNSPLAGAPKL